MTISPYDSVYAAVRVKVRGVEQSQMFVVDGSANNDALLGMFVMEHAIRPALNSKRKHHTPEPKRPRLMRHDGKTRASYIRMIRDAIDKDEQLAMRAYGFCIDEIAEARALCL